jgi:hypothetical protein
MTRYSILRLQTGAFGHAHAHQILGLGGGDIALAHMHPRTLVPDIDHLEEVGIHAGLGTGTGKERMMGARRAGGDHHPVEVVFL